MKKDTIIDFIRDRKKIEINRRRINLDENRQIEKDRHNNIEVEKEKYFCALKIDLRIKNDRYY